ncbi:hypothetical protein [Paraburkholderia acidisoli]|uniref:Uncharacterized protein n=1 Tax=Paraburkholderia acidisoli TaxID=2571748 RepID=A0A7Z2JJT4_9BURK|nr:hypothetical protein [Paraburkholderia acidisoli]QGZ66608.1 hypothetical protein FAZ98_33160 [Paraburkholderia acidisoli]
MKRSTLIQCRAYLWVGSIAALVIQIAAVAALLVFNVPEAVFTSSAFRVAVVALVVAAVFVAQWFAAQSFRAALAREDIAFAQPGQNVVEVSSECPRRAFVMLHVLLNPRRLALASPPSGAARAAGSEAKPGRSLPQSLIERKPAMSRGSTRT